MNSNNSKKCSNCNNIYDLTHYIPCENSKTSKQYTKVCEKCRKKNKRSMCKKKEKVKSIETDESGKVCTNCNCFKPNDYYISKTGKRFLKVCSICRKTKTSNDLCIAIQEKHEKTTDIIDTSVDINSIGNKFNCAGCSKEFIKTNLFNTEDRTMCNNCKIIHNN